MNSTNDILKKSYSTKKKGVLKNLKEANDSIISRKASILPIFSNNTNKGYDIPKNNKSINNKPDSEWSKGLVGIDWLSRTYTSIPFSFGNKLRFNGLNSNIEGVNLSLDKLTFSLSFWVEINSSKFHGLTCEFSGDNLGTLFIRGSSNILHLIDDSGSSQHIGVIPLNTKTHIAISYDGVNVSSYINGILYTTLPSSGLGGINLLGSRGNINTLFLDGTLNEFAISTNYSLTQEDAMNLYNSSDGTLATDILSGVVRYYRFNQSNGDISLKDSTGNQDGILTGFEGNNWILD